MRKRYSAPTPPDTLIPNSPATLPTEAPIAVYYRQSTDAQVGNVSTAIQTVDMVLYLKQRGWDEANINLIDSDAGISGTTKIDERPGMKELFDLITSRKISAVACQDEDRLFRDVTQIQVNIFIEACRTANVLVLTPSMVYDFANELTGTFHARQFRFKSEMAAEYLNTVVRGKLLRAKRRVMMEGRWAGTTMPPGYMVDRRKTLPNGSANEHWRKFVPFPAYAEIINEYFRLFLSYNGNMLATLKHIQKHGPYYPDLSECPPPEGYKAVYRLNQRGGGLCPERSAFAALLSNVTYLGHWVVNNTVVRWDNHPAIVPQAVFMRAFNYISPVGLEGEPNLHYKPFQQYARPSKEQDRPVERPLYAGMIVAQANGEWRSVGTTWLKTLQHYIYVHCTPRPDEHRLWIKTAMFVDEEITNLVIERLRKTFDPTVWEQTLAALEEKYVAASSPVIAQRSTLERVMQNYLLSLKTLDTPEMIQQVEADYKAAQEEHKRLSHQLRILSNEAEWLEALRDLKKDHDPAIANWENLTRNQRRVVLHGFIDRIEAEPIEERALQFTVYWKNGESNTVILTRQSENGWQEWLQSDVERLLQIVDRGASQIEITQAFPKRTWKMIKMKVESIRGAGSLILSPKPMYEYETYEMYIGRVGLNPPTYQARSGDDWTPDEVKQLLELIDNGASRVELAAVFPHRKWGRIRFKITRLRGKNVPIPGFGTIRREETIDAYRVRLGEIEPHGESTQHIVSFDPSQSMHNYAVESRKRLLA